MSLEHVSHKDILKFAEDRIFLKQEHSKKYREQANRLKEKLEGYLKDHPDFSLKKIIRSGSLAKGTALKTLNDIDMACYVSGADVPSEIDELLNYLESKLETAFANMSPDQVKRQNNSICISFKGTGLDIDVVPILYHGDENWYGELVSQDIEEYLETCIPRHIEFIRNRKNVNKDFANVVRLVKEWARIQKQKNQDFKFKSFMLELTLAHLSDQGIDFSDYVEVLQSFFTYIAQDGFTSQIAFDDYYSLSDIPSFSEPIQIIDPVNPKNNAAKLYTTIQRELIVNAAIDAGDAVDSAIYATTKERSLYYWRQIFGPTFNV